MTMGKKAFIWNMIGSTATALTSLVYLLFVTRLNGVNDAGIFSFSFSNATLFYIVGIYITRTFQVCDISNITDSDYFNFRIISCIIMMLIGIVMVILSDYSIYKITIYLLLMFYKALDAFGEVLYAIMQKQDRLANVGFSMFCKSMCSMLLFLVCDYLTNNLILSLIIICLVYLAFMLIYDRVILKKIYFKLEKSTLVNMLDIVKNGFYIFVTSFLTIYVVNAAKYAIDAKLTENLQAVFGIVLMPATIISLFAQYIIHPFLNKMNNAFNDNDLKTFRMIVNKMIIILIVFTLTVAGGAYIVGIPILQLIYGIELTEYKISLLLIIFGGGFLSLITTLSAALVVMKSTLSQMIIYVVMGILSFLLANYLVDIMGVFGASISYVLVMLFGFIAYYIYYQYRLRSLNS